MFVLPPCRLSGKEISAFLLPSEKRNLLYACVLVPSMSFISPPTRSPFRKLMPFTNAEAVTKRGYFRYKALMGLME